MSRIAFVVLVLMFCAAIYVDAHAADLIEGEADVVADLLDLFDGRNVSNALNASVSSADPSGRVRLPAIFLHPQDGEPAALRFPDLALPQIGRDERLVLKFAVGMRDGIPYDDPTKPKFDGVEFSVRVNGTLAFREIVLDAGWRHRAVDLTRYAGSAVEVALGTEKVVTSSYDWALFGEPLVLTLRAKGRRTLQAGGQPPAGRLDAARGIVYARRAEAADRAADTWHRITVTPTSVDVASTAAPPSGEAPDIALAPFDFGGSTGQQAIIGPFPGPIAEIGLYLYRPELSVAALEATSAVVLARAPIKVAARIRNTGRGGFVPNGGRIALTIADDAGHTVFRAEPVPLQPLSHGEDRWLIWENAAGLSAGTYTISLSDETGSGTIASFTRTLDVVPKPDDRPEVALQGRGARFTFPRVGGLHNYGQCYAADPSSPDKWDLCANVRPLSSLVTFRENGSLSEEIEIPFALEEKSADRVELAAKFSRLSADFVATAVFQLGGSDSDVLDFECTLEADRAVGIARFAGPRVAVGDHTFGAAHDVAVLPGLEYLGKNDYSSSTLDAAPPISDRRVPDPYKITIPLAAVGHAGRLVAMMWDMNHAWDGTHRHMAVEFDVPPPETGAGHSVMQLFAPGVPDWVPETKTVAAEPYLLEPGKTLSIKGELYVCSGVPERSRRKVAKLKDATVALALSKYYEQNGVPKVMPHPRTWDAEKALSRDAWFESIWVEEAKGWRHAFGEHWKPESAPGMATLVLFDYYDTQDPSLRARLRERVDTAMEEALRRHGPDFLFSNANCHIMLGEYPFYEGHLSEAVDGWRGAAEGRLSGQKPSGAWVWNPGGDEKRKPLGTPGQDTIGTCSGNAYFVLKLGRITGDRKYIDAGLKAVEYMERYYVPRGAQGWECPLHSPDILASAYAVRANVEAYRITGDGKYLDNARYWAWSGLPFIYMWDLEHIPSMRYNTIPIFGATYFTHSWFGKPVVWCGLVYAYALQELAQFDDSFEWRTIADGVTTSAMWQQYDDDRPSRGCYPDGFDIRQNKRYPADISPEDIMVNMFALRGLDPGIKTVRAQLRGRTVYISSGARIEKVSDGDSVTFRARFFPGEAAYTLVSPVAGVSEVRAGESALPQVDDPTSAEPGWRFYPDKDRLVIKLKFGTEPLDVTVR